MLFPTAKLTELPLRSTLPLTSHSLFSTSTLPKPPFHPFRVAFTSSSASFKTNKKLKPRNPNSSPRTIWRQSKWPPVEDPPRKAAQSDGRQEKIQSFSKDKGQNAIERIVLRLRNLGLGIEEEQEGETEETGIFSHTGDRDPVTGEERLSDLLKREWVRPDTIFTNRGMGNAVEDELVLPWEREEERETGGEMGQERKRRVKAPTLAELTLEDEELRGLRKKGMCLRERISVPKAGLTKEVMQKIHDKWRKEELVRLKFHEVLARDMRTAHELVERRTGGLVIWRAGSVMVVFRGNNYQGPLAKCQTVEREGDACFVPNASSPDSVGAKSSDLATAIAIAKKNEAYSIAEKSESSVMKIEHNEKMTEEEAEYNSLLDGLGPRFEEWWGTGLLPVDADLLPKTVPGYKTPFRLLPTGMRSRLTNAEMTNLRKLAKSLPCHFALGTACVL
uniref:CRM domain-containing protein n=1 Tax=Rhizophora mucronata TaxID=61149 RepID=A0A2P2LBF6_RHIMU